MNEAETRAELIDLKLIQDNGRKKPLFKQNINHWKMRWQF